MKFCDVVRALEGIEHNYGDDKDKKRALKWPDLKVRLILFFIDIDSLNF